VSSEPVLYEVGEAGVATITLNDPDTRNALSPELLGALLAAFARAREEEAVRCVVLASSHEKTFSSGANLGGFAGEQPLVHKHFGSERFVDLFKLIGELGKPTICAVRGHVLAGAFGIALACDLILASEEASFGTPEINVGTFPFMIMALIYRNVPRKKANELLLLGERLSAQDALAAGIVNRVVPAAELDAYVKTYAQTIADNAPLTIATTKFTIGEVVKEESKRNLEKCAAMVKQCFESNDYTEGRRAFMERRKPVFTGT
jgi:enoyl-CoA hydratase